MFVRSMGITASALSAERLRADIIGQNIANAKTTRTEDGTPYRRQVVVFKEQVEFSDALNSARGSRNLGKGSPAGVAVSQVLEDEVTPFTPVYDPSHPDADENGYYYIPNVDTTKEVLDAMEVSNSYASNLSVLNTYKEMINAALQIGK